MPCLFCGDLMFEVNFVQCKGFWSIFPFLNVWVQARMSHSGSASSSGSGSTLGFVLGSTSGPGLIQYMREPSISNLSIREVFSKNGCLGPQRSSTHHCQLSIKVSSFEWSISKNKTQFYLTRTKLPGSERSLNRSLLAFTFLENLHNSSISQNWRRPFNNAQAC